MTTTSGLIRKVEGFRPVFEELKKRGVQIRIVAPLTAETKNAVKDLDGLAEVRHHANKARFIVVDGKEVVFMIMDDEEVHPTYDVGIWVNTPFFSAALDSLFNMAWETMETAKKFLKLTK